MGMGMNYFVNIKVKNRWVRVRAASLSMANELVEQYRERGFEAHASLQAHV